VGICILIGAEQAWVLLEALLGQSFSDLQDKVPV
jgi:hypothetical protein